MLCLTRMCSLLSFINVDHELCTVTVLHAVGFPIFLGLNYIDIFQLTENESYMESTVCKIVNKCRMSKK